MPNPQSAVPAPSLIVISGGQRSAAPSPRPESQTRLLKSLPAASRVLQIGALDSALERDHRRAHPACEWFACSALSDAVQGPFDLIVLPNGLHDIADPLALLRELARVSGEQTTLVIAVTNQARLAMLRRWVEGDLTDADTGALAQPHLRYASAASVYKLLMDAGWMPHLADASPASVSNDAFSAATWAMTDALAIPRATAQRTLTTEQLVIHAQRRFDASPVDTGRARFAVVVPTTRESQLRLNVEHSPGLQEVDARIVSCRHATSPADALARALEHCSEDWVLLCHQDVYFPAGFGAQLQAVLAAVPDAERDRTLIGFAGIGVNAQTHGYDKAGFVIDRLHRFDHPVSAAAVSIDEFAVVLSRRSVHRIDPQLGWHLWATDLCLSAICTHQVFARIVRLPVFHNSVNDYRLPQAFYDSAATLAAKHASFGPITTLCGTIDADFLTPARRAAP